jgi:serine/threonine protein kinase/tetratricopeptide (TPR) repeat protein
MSIQLGRYQVVEALGQGGMGVVYRAEDPLLERAVAIKVIHPHRMTAEAKERFFREARAVARLDSHHIVKVFDIGIQPDGVKELHYIVMEFVRGQTLARYIEGQGPPNKLALRDRLGYYSQLLDAIYYAHQQGVVHRDLKPENVMITPEGRVKIMDFGLAVLDDKHSQTRDNQIMGTLAYFAPEQAKGTKGVDLRADIYALGVILFEIATGSLPFMGENPLEFIHKVLHEPPPCLADLNPEVPWGLEKMALRALRKEPSERFSSVLEMTRELEEVLQTQFSTGGSKPAPATPKPPPMDLPIAKLGTASSISLPKLPIQMPILKVPPPPSLEATRSDFLQRFQKSDAGAAPVVPGSPPVASPQPPIHRTVVDSGPPTPPVGSPPSVPFKVAQGLPLVASSGWMDEARNPETARQQTSNPMARDDKRQQELAPPLDPNARRSFCQACGCSNPAGSVQCLECGQTVTPSYYVIQREAILLAQQSRDALADGLYEEALDLSEQALAHDADLGEAHLCRGRALLGLHRLDPAEAALVRACDQLPKSSQPWLVMAEVFLARSDFEGVIASLLEALRRDPVDVQARLRLAYLYGETGRAAEAIEQYKRVLERNPRNAEANRQMGLMLARCDRPDEATRFLEQANQIDPSDVQTCLLLGRLYARRRQFALAQEAFESVIQSRGDDAELRAELGALYQAQNQDEQALRELRRAVELDQTNRDARLRMSAIFEKHGRLDHAAKELEEALRFQPHDLALNRRLGELYLQRNDLNRALSVYENVVRLDPKCAEMHNKLGRIYLKKDYTAQAIEHYQHAVEAHKVEPEYREDLAMAHYCNGDFPSAIAELKRAAMLDGRNADYAKGLGLLHFLVGDDEEAVRCLQFSLQLRPGDSQAQGIVGQALARQGLANLAIGAFQKALELDNSNHILYLYQARALALAGRHGEAIQSFRNFASRLSSRDEALYLAHTQVEMGLSYLADGKVARAAEVLQLALKTNPRDAKALHGLAKVAMEKRDWSEAREKLRKALQIEPKNRDFLVTLAEIQGCEGNWSEAVLTLQRGVTENPNEPMLYELLGRALRKAGRVQEAASVFRRGAEVFPAEQGRFYWLEGRVEARRGRFGEAATLFRRALERNPDRWRIYADLAETCQQLGEIQEALANVDKALSYAGERDREELKRLQLLLQTQRIREG